MADDVIRCWAVSGVQMCALRIHLLAAALLVEYQCREPAQGLARLLDRAAVGVHSGQLLDETDIALLGLEVHRSECEASLFHVDPLSSTRRLRGWCFQRMSAE